MRASLSRVTEVHSPVWKSVPRRNGEGSRPVEIKDEKGSGCGDLVSETKTLFGFSTYIFNFEWRDNTCTHTRQIIKSEKRDN